VPVRICGGGCYWGSLMGCEGVGSTYCERGPAL